MGKRNRSSSCTDRGEESKKKRKKQKNSKVAILFDIVFGLVNAYRALYSCGSCIIRALKHRYSNLKQKDDMYLYIEMEAI